MQTLTLCEGLTGLHCRPLNPKNPGKHLRLCPPLPPTPSKHGQKSSLRNSRQGLFANSDKRFLGHCRRDLQSHKHGTGPGFFNDDNTLELAKITHSQDLLDKIPKCKNSLRGSHVIDPVELYRSPPSGIAEGLKLALLAGFLIIQGSERAVASTEFAGAMQLSSYIGDLGDISTGFASAFLLIFFSELGDKTFFIAALLAARNSGGVVFIGTFGALAAMTIISVILGRSFHYVDDILPFRFGDMDFPIDDFAAVCLLVYFGVTTLREAVSGDGFKIQEEQKEAEVAVSELSGNGAGIMAAANTVISTFLLVFVAEWGDKSFFSTIALAAASSPLGVIGGALAGHALATLLAVLGGSILGTFFSEKVIAYIGGSLFLVFAVVTLIEIVT